MYADHIGILPNGPHNSVIHFDLLFFRYAALCGLLVLDPDVAPKTKDLLAHRFLETIGKRERNDHHGDADSSGYNG